MCAVVSSELKLTRWKCLVVKGSCRQKCMLEGSELKNIPLSKFFVGVRVTAWYVCVCGCNCSMTQFDLSCSA